jgi:hypothetical protein
LHRIALDEGFLYRMQTVPVGDTFNGRNLLPGHAGGWSDARAAWNTIDQNRAGSALPLAAAVLGASEVEFVPQNEKQ